MQNARLMGEAQADNRFWRVSWSKAATGQWYFVELTWLAERGLQMFVDLTSVAWARNYTVREPPSEPGTGFAYLGRDNSDMGRGTRYAVTTLDEVEICYGDRDQLMMMNYILRGEHWRHSYCIHYQCTHSWSHSASDYGAISSDHIYRGIGRRSNDLAKIFVV